MPRAYLASFPCSGLFLCRKRKANSQMPKNFVRNRLGDAGNCVRFIDPRSIAMWAERPYLREECISSDPVIQMAGGNGELFRHTNTLELADCWPWDGSAGGRRMDGFPEKNNSWDCGYGSMAAWITPVLVCCGHRGCQ